MQLLADCRKGFRDQEIPAAVLAIPTTANHAKNLRLATALLPLSFHRELEHNKFPRALPRAFLSIVPSAVGRVRAISYRNSPERSSIMAKKQVSQPRRKRSRDRGRAVRRLHLENLEPRQMMAADAVLDWNAIALDAI